MMYLKAIVLAYIIIYSISLFVCVIIAGIQSELVDSHLTGNITSKDIDALSNTKNLFKTVLAVIITVSSLLIPISLFISIVEYLQ